MDDEYVLLRIHDGGITKEVRLCMNEVKRRIKSGPRTCCSVDVCEMFE